MGRQVVKAPKAAKVALSNRGAEPAYLSTGQVARRLGVAKNTLLRAARLGEIQVAWRMPGGALRFLPADVDAYAASLTTHRQAPVPADGAGAVAPPIHVGFERLAQVATIAANGLDGLIPDILAMLADSLHVGLTFLARADGPAWRIDWVYDRVGMGLLAGMEMPLWETCIEAVAAGAAATLIVDDVQTDARFSTATAAQKRGLGSYTGVPLRRPDGQFYGALCTVHPRPRNVPDGEIALLRLAGRIVMQAVEAEALRQRERRLTDQIAASEEQYRRIVETAREGIVHSDADNNMVYVNQRLADMLGYTVDELVGRPIISLVAEDARGIVESNQRRRREGHRGSYLHDLKLRTKGGADLWVIVSSIPVFDAEGHFQGGTSMLTDITARKQIEEKLRQSEEHYRRIVETAQEGILLLDAEGRLTYVNQCLPAMLGYTAQEMLSQTLFAFMDQEQGVATRLAFAQRRHRLTETRQFDARFRHKDGSEVWVLASTVALTDQAGQFAGEFGMLTNITERKKVEEALRRSAEWFRALSENATDLVSVVDTQGRYRYVSPSYETILGYAPAQLLGTAFFDLLHPGDRTTIERQWPSWLAQPTEPSHSTLRVRHADGSWRWLESAARAALDNPAISGIIGNARDVSERVQAEHERAEVLAREQLSREEAAVAREAERVKNELLRTVSHELRTPLAAIKGFASALLDYGSTLDAAEVAESLRSIDTSTDRLTELIENLLQMQRLDGGHLDVQRHPLDLADVVQAAVAELRPSLSAHTLTVQAPQSLPLVQGDARRLHQVAVNLIGNAVKYSPRGGRIEVRLAERAGMVELRVQDEGLGIPRDQLQRIFEPFYRVDSSATLAIYGTGLGLSIVRSLVAAHAGRVWAESAGPGRGSTFVVALPPAGEADPA